VSCAGRGAERRAGDAYYTPASAILPILPHLAPWLLSGPGARRRRVLEPSAGDGSIVRELRGWVEGQGAAPLDVVTVDIDPAVGADVTGDFLGVVDATEAARRLGGPADLIITNPPFRHAWEFARQALYQPAGLLAPGGALALLLRLNFLGGQRRAAWHRDHPADVFVLPKRPSFTDDGKTDATEYAWFVWEAWNLRNPRSSRRSGRVTILGGERGAQRSARSAEEEADAEDTPGGVVDVPVAGAVEAGKVVPHVA
jgi:hypothetical protein